jgi:hypothetical protein
LSGSRATYQKHKKQNSPYRHLLLPKAGGVALVFSSMGDYLSNVIDVTPVYPDLEPPVRFWDLLSGRVRRMVVRIALLPVPENVAGMNYAEDPVYREQIQQWVNLLWQVKDRRIESQLEEKPAEVNKVDQRA